MSCFYCDLHQRLEDDDERGYNFVQVNGADVEVCDDGLADIEYEMSLAEEERAQEAALFKGLESW